MDRQQPNRTSSSADKLLEQVTGRLKLTSFVRTCFFTFVVSSVLFVAAFAASRLLGLYPFEWDPLVIGVVPLLALFLGVVFHRRPTKQQAAQAIDARAETKDLFLTLSLLQHSAGEYQPLVEQAADEQTKHVQPQRIVPYGWDKRGWCSVLTIGLLVVLVLFVPQLDPFGKIEEAVARERRREELEEMAKATRERRKRLEKKQASDEAKGAETSQDVKRAIDAMLDTLKEMENREPEKNEEALRKELKKLGNKWNQVRNSADLKELLKQNNGQAFGRNMQEMREMIDQLRKGNPEQLQKKIDKIKDQLQKLQKLQKEDKDDPETLKKKEKLKREVKKAIEQMEELAKKNVGKESKLREAVARALAQLEAGDSDKKLSDEAIKQALESLELSKDELEQIAKSAKDLEMLQKSLEAVQQARALNQKAGGSDKLDIDWGNQPTLDEIREQYSKMLADMGIGGKGDGDAQGGGKGDEVAGQGAGGDERKNGVGTGGAGTGKGGKVPENDKAAGKFVKRKSLSHVQVGKMLFTMKSRGVSEAGDVNVEYKKLIKQLKDGYSEAIEQEEIPPGYIPGIKKYFDRLEENLPAEAPANAN